MLHAQERAFQRYNKVLYGRDISNIQKIILANQHTLLYPTEDDPNKLFCYVKYNHIPYKILYTIQEDKCKIITIYPFDVDEYNELMEIKEQQEEQKKIEKAITLLKEHGYIVYKRDK